MQVLLAEDREEARNTYEFMINRFNKKNNVNIVPIIVNSYSELKAKLLTFKFDGVIIDNNFEYWQKDLKNGGELVCDNLQKLLHFNNPRSQIFLYSANNIEKKDVPYTCVSKTIETDSSKKFNEKILELLIQNENFTEIDYEDFLAYPTSRKRAYYKKNVLDKMRKHYRYSELAPNLSWTSDLTDENSASLLGKLLKGKTYSLEYTKQIDYSELDNTISKNTKVPTISWNFCEFDFFNLQNTAILSHEFKNEFVFLFYQTALSNSLSKQILEKSSLLDTNLNFIHLKNQTILRETQCSFIKLLYEEEELNIKQKIKPLSQKFNHNIIDYFIGTLDSFDEETDEASVRLNSMIDRTNYYYETISYSLLKANGIEYVDTDFLYCAYEYNSKIDTYIELK